MMMRRDPATKRLLEEWAEYYPEDAGEVGPKGGPLPDLPERLRWDSM